jgi:hypothetical protein
VAVVSTYDAVTHVYDAPARLSTPHAMAETVRGTPAGPSAVSWGNYVSSGRFGVAAETAVGAEPSVGQTIYRVYGGDSPAGGASWSPVNPGSVANFRDAAGLPSGCASGPTNTGQFVIKGTLNDPAAVVLQECAHT